jgi:hypothetical protein
MTYESNYIAPHRQPARFSLRLFERVGADSHVEAAMTYGELKALAETINTALVESCGVDGLHVIEVRAVDEPNHAGGIPFSGFAIGSIGGCEMCDGTEPT